MHKVPAFLKRFVESAINFANRLQRDIFWRTQFVVLAMLFFLCVANILIVIFSSSQLHLEVASVVVGYITDAIANGGTIPDLNSSLMLSQIYALRNAYIIFVGGSSIIATLLFGYILARIALIPTRNALSAQKQFIGNIAHELRTPLAIVRANNEIISWEAAKQSETSKLAHSNLEELDRISGIINNLLTLNTFHHVEEMVFSYVDVSQLLHGSVQKYERHIQNKALRIKEDINQNILVWGNQNAIGQMTDNIVKNAIAYTGQGGAISIAARKAGKMYAVITVADSGIGIDQEKLHRIFEPFYQADPSRSEALNSSGLGLTIVSELIKLHHGAINIDSIPKKGTTVELRLPLEPKRRFMRVAHRKQEHEHGITLNYTELAKNR